MLPDERKRRVDRLKAKRLEKQKANQDLITQLADKIDDLRKTFDVGLKVNGLNEIIDSLGSIQTFSEDVTQLKAAISAVKFPDQVKVGGLDELSKAIAANKVPDNTEQFENIYTKLDELVEKASDNIKIANQAADEYIPVRRVRLVAGKLLFDDAASGGGSGGISYLYAEDRSEITGRGTATDTANTEIIAAQASRVVITDIIISNTSAVDTEVNLKYGNTTKITYPAPQKSGAVHALSKPLVLPAGSALNFAAADSATSIKVSAIGYLVT